MWSQNNDLVENNNKSSSKTVWTSSVFPSLWETQWHGNFSPEGLKLNTRVVRTPLFQHYKNAELLLCASAATKDPGKSRTRTSTLGDTRDKRQMNSTAAKVHPRQHRDTAETVLVWRSSKVSKRVEQMGERLPSLIMPSPDSPAGESKERSPPWDI